MSSTQSFAELGLRPEILRAVADAGYTIPTPIQAQAIPLILEGLDVMGGAQTGTGKTAGFALPILQKLLAAGQYQSVAGTAPGPGAHPDADARARDPGRGGDRRLRQAHGAPLDRRLRRRRHTPAASDRARRRRDPRRDPGPIAGPHRAEIGLPGPGRDLRARRGRSHARHGLHSRHQADHGAAAGDREATEPAFLGDVLQRDQEARRPAPERTAIDRGGAPQHHGGNGLAKRVQGGCRAQARLAGRHRHLAQSVAGALFRAHQARRVAPRPTARKGRAQDDGDSRRQEPGGASRGARRLQGGESPGDGRDRRRGARPRHRRSAAGDQLRAPLRSRGLHPPDRPHRPRRRERRSDFVLLTGRRKAADRNRADAQAIDSRGRRRRTRAGTCTGAR